MWIEASSRVKRLLTSATMDVWHPVQSTWFVQHTVVDKELLVLITDFQRLWLERLTAETVNERNHNCNPHMNFETSKLLETISTVLSSAGGSSNSITLSQSSSGDVIDLQASSMAVGGRLKFDFKATCQAQPPAIFAKHVTRPLLAVASAAILVRPSRHPVVVMPCHLRLL